MVVVGYGLPLVANLTTYVKDTTHALEIANSFDFNNSNPHQRFLREVTVHSDTKRQRFTGVGLFPQQASGTRATNFDTNPFS